MTRDDDPAVLRWPNWLGLVVDDLEAARHFYGQVMGLEAIDAGDHWVQYDMGEQRIFELLRRDPGQAQYERTRFQPGIAVGDIERARERLKVLGAEQVTDVEGGPEHGVLVLLPRSRGTRLRDQPARAPASDPPTVSGADLR